jgi:hypothetical protein
MIIKLRSERRGEDRVVERILMGEDEKHLKLVGSLTLNVGEWQLFGAALLLGAEHTKTNLRIIFEGDEEVVGIKPVEK